MPILLIVNYQNRNKLAGKIAQVINGLLGSHKKLVQTPHQSHDNVGCRGMPL